MKSNKATSFFLLFAALAIYLRAADIPVFEFYGGSPNQKQSSLIFDVTETATGHRDLHTVFIIKATVVESELDVPKSGTEFIGYFDRVYSSIFGWPETHPMKIGDRVEIGVTKADADSISGFLKKKVFREPPNPTWNNTDAITIGRMTMIPRSDFIRSLHQDNLSENVETVCWHTKDDRHLTLLYFADASKRSPISARRDSVSNKSAEPVDVGGIAAKLFMTDGFFGYGIEQYVAHIPIDKSLYVFHSGNIPKEDFKGILQRVIFNKEEPNRQTTPAKSSGIDNDHTLISVEAVVSPKTYPGLGEIDEEYFDEEIYTTRLEVKTPEPKFERFLEVRRTKRLPPDHPFRQKGTTVTFTTERRYLVNILSNPAERHDFAALFLDAISNLKVKEPN